MRMLVAVLNLGLGAIYTSYGVMTAYELKSGWRRRGFSHFGLAWLFMAFTCGPHHLVHGFHAAFEGRAGGPLDVLAVVVGLPAGLAWFLLRVEALAGGRGDRTLRGTPAWLAVMPALAGSYLAALVAAMQRTGPPLHFAPAVVPSVMLLIVYCAIGYFLVRAQVVNHRIDGDWSISGIALGIVFPTCALMHAVFAYYSARGVYAFDPHGFVIDVLSVPAGLYFLWVVHGLYVGTLTDWNQPAELEPAG